MKRIILFLISLFLVKSALGQDSTKIIFTEEPDTLVKQRFIDRYDNVFMTKVPTRHMFKIGISQYYQAISFTLHDDFLWNNTSLQVGYEFKFLPAFSVAISGHIPFYGKGIPFRRAWGNSVIDAQLRWFFNMRNRIQVGKSANNFSGNYLALNYTLPSTIQDNPTIGIKLGFQRRFLNNGFMDFAIALQQEVPWFHYGILDNWAFSSQANFGFAFGDWKKADKTPLCDLLLCDEFVVDQLKIKLPELTFGYNLSRIRLGVAYERKIKTSPFSLNVQFDIGLSKGYNYMKMEKIRYPDFYGTFDRFLSKEMSMIIAAQPRYYFLQNRQRLRGRGGNGLSGVYAGINTEYNFYSGRHSEIFKRDKVIQREVISYGPLAGFQQRLFEHGYVDLNISYNVHNEVNKNERSLGFRGNLGLGFAF